MGLDMYLEKHNYVKNWDHLPEDQRWDITVSGGRGANPPTIQPERIKYIIEEVAYWRKFNALHNWFIQNCAGGTDDCTPVYVDPEQLEELLVLVQDVIATKETRGEAEGAKRAREVFEPVGGFFFGSTEIDEWYWQDMSDLVETLKSLLAEPGDSDFYYRASW
jgi:hypothetical protein